MFSLVLRNAISPPSTPPPPPLPFPTLSSLAPPRAWNTRWYRRCRTSHCPVYYSRLCSVQDGIYALGKAHMRSTTSHSVSVFVSLCFCLCLTVSVSLCLYVSVSVCLCLSLSLSLSLFRDSVCCGRNFKLHEFGVVIISLFTHKESIGWCTKTTRPIRDGGEGGGGGGEYGGGERGRLCTYRYTVTTRMTPALRWAAMRAILMFH